MTTFRYLPAACSAGARILTIGLALAGAMSCRADVAVLREKGPWSGTAFSNPGLVEGAAPGTKIAMRTANVRIQLSRGQGETLVAKCEAEFELVNTMPGKSKAGDILVAFPVTGLASKIVTVSDFTVLIDGRRPATVLRQAIIVSRRSMETKDTPIHGQLEARFHVKDPQRTWGVTLADESIYRNAYVWAQATTPGEVSRVKVAYSVALRPQAIRYTKSYSSSDTDDDVIPFADLGIHKWDEDHYFFDYVLMSGSTWDGPIGKESIKLEIDPSLRLAPERIETLQRQPIGRHRDAQKKTGAAYSESVTPTGMEWTVTGKPDGDLLIAIPKSALGAAPHR
jgi:hypothetical protein